MCRMFASFSRRAEQQSIVSALVRAARNDVFRNGEAHRDGWGCALASGDAVFTWRSTRPIYQDLPAIPDALGQTFLALFHARLAADGEPVNAPAYSHPFTVTAQDGHMYVCHNGWVDKEKVGREYGVRVEGKSDTQVMCEAMSTLGKGAFEGFREVMEFCRENAMKGALNVLALFIGNGRMAEVYYHSSLLKESVYGRLYSRQTGGSFAVMSSTVAYYMGLIDASGQPLVQDTMAVEENACFRESFTL
ncbi:class II glutamine amidotransferase [Thermogymnomonas acidicola]|uniref:Class II glutamine amidotransferase n=1 Tax=Thermogymnomonas acidicola TaxID=399579 RepID=A0AA37BR43_9ARCH|nr:hypothetical protein [Thermogymnomonas acidicola]GGM73246.1 class II glutamine amidotransferase [Thermogymnomonas acidicola]